MSVYRSVSTTADGKRHSYAINRRISILPLEVNSKVGLARPGSNLYYQRLFLLELLSVFLQRVLPATEMLPGLGFLNLVHWDSCNCR